MQAHYKCIHSKQKCIKLNYSTIKCYQNQRRTQHESDHRRNQETKQRTAYLIHDSPEQSTQSPVIILWNRSFVQK